MLQAAGVLCLVKNQQVLLLKRSADSDFPGTWCLPGGKLEPGETSENAAIREFFEETGYSPYELSDRPLTLLARRQKDGVDFTTYLQRVDNVFSPKLNAEHDDYLWANKDELPQPLHPGTALAIAKLDMNELDIARAMAAGDLTSPQRYENLALFAVRITGTGVAFRRGLGKDKKGEEFVIRDPSLYFNDDFLARCNGLLVIANHPEGSTVTHQEFLDRTIGNIFLPYARPELKEIWGIAKIYDQDAAKMMEEQQLSTSPAVVFRDPAANTKAELPDGSALLIEGVPSLLDHLAVCLQGVWDKGGEPTGVISTNLTGGSQMDESEVAKKDAEEMEKARKDAEAKLEEERADRARKDADAGQQLDKVLKFLDSVEAKMDAMCNRMDAMEAERMDKRKDAEGDAPGAEGEGKPEPEMPAETMADKARKDRARKDAEDEEEMAKMDRARKDAEEVRKRIDELESKLPKQMTDADYGELSEAQAKADAVFAAYGDAAPRPLNGETALMYRRRTMGQIIKDRVVNPALKALNVHGMSAEMVNFVEPQVFADAVSASRRMDNIPAGQLREQVTTDSTGRRMTSFYGRPSTWMGEFAGPAMRVVGFDKKGGR